MSVATNHSAASTPLRLSPASEDRPTPPPGLSSQPFCSHCRATQTPLWRRNPDDSASVLCNACGLFLKLKGMPRPLSLKTDVPRTRKRHKASDKDSLDGASSNHHSSSQTSQPPKQKKRNSKSDSHSFNGDYDIDYNEHSVNENSPNQNNINSKLESPKRGLQHQIPKDYDFTAPYMIKRPRKSKYDITEMAPPKSILETLGIEVPGPGGNGKLDSQSISKLVGGIAPLSNSQVQNTNPSSKNNNSDRNINNNTSNNNDSNNNSVNSSYNIDSNNNDNNQQHHSYSSNQEYQPLSQSQQHSHNYQQSQQSLQLNGNSPIINHNSSLNPTSSLSAAQVPPNQIEIQDEITSKPMIQSQSHSSSPVNFSSRSLNQKSLSMILNNHSKSSSFINHPHEPVDQVRLLKAQVQELERSYDNAMKQLDKYEKEDYAFKLKREENSSDNNSNTDNGSEINNYDSKTNNNDNNNVDSPSSFSFSDDHRKSSHNYGKRRYNRSSSPDIEREAFENIRFKRTEIRIKRLCASNRSGLRMCAWHDANRTPPLYGPRAAPPGIMSCGCTFEQTLFEETLARNGIGSVFPGDVTRLDSKMRDQLLQLLEWQYGYVDGDLDRNPTTGSLMDVEELGLSSERDTPHKLQQMMN